MRAMISFLALRVERWGVRRKKSGSMARRVMMIGSEVEDGEMLYSDLATALSDLMIPRLAEGVVELFVSL